MFVVESLDPTATANNWRSTSRASSGRAFT